MCQRILSALLLLAGVLGTISCVAAIVATWTISTRVTRATEKVFDTADGVIGGVRERVAKIDERVQALKITSEEIREDVKTWAKSEVAQRVGSRLGVEQRAEFMLTEIDKAEQWLVLSESSVQLLEQAVGASRSLGISTENDSLKNLLLEIREIQTQLGQGIEIARNISQRAAEVGEGKLTADKSEQIGKLIVRVVATLGVVDARIQKIEDHLAKIETQVQAEKQKLIRWVNLAAIGITVIFAWMAAGQCALCYLGVRGLRRPAAAVSPTA